VRSRLRRVRQQRLPQAAGFGIFTGAKGGHPSLRQLSCPPKTKGKQLL
jgi:hypothetical protein